MVKQRNQKGFGAVEVLLVLILVAIVVFVGYYIYHSQKTASSTYNNAGKAAQQSTTAQSKGVLFKLDNLGVQMYLPASQSNFTYTPTTFSDGSSGGYVSTKAISDLINQCISEQGANAESSDPESLSFAGLGEVNGQYDSSQAAESQLLKQFSSFYVTISTPNGMNPCANNQTQMDKLQALETAALNVFKQAFKSTATATN